VHVFSSLIPYLCTFSWYPVLFSAIQLGLLDHTVVLVLATRFGSGTFPTICAEENGEEKSSICECIEIPYLEL